MNLIYDCGIKDSIAVFNRFNIHTTSMFITKGICYFSIKEKKKNNSNVITYL